MKNIKDFIKESLEVRNNDGKKTAITGKMLNDMLTILKEQIGEDKIKNCINDDSLDIKKLTGVFTQNGMKAKRELTNYAEENDIQGILTTPLSYLITCLYNNTSLINSANEKKFDALLKHSYNIPDSITKCAKSI